MKDCIKVLFPHYESGELNYESAWARKSEDNFQLDNILFYAKEYSYRDTFSVKKIDNEFHVDELVEESGHSTIRILFSYVSLVEKIRKELKEMGCDSELSNINRLISVDIPPAVEYFLKIKPYLDSGENNELWEYQEACLSSAHNI